MKTVPTYTATIYCGLREDYSDRVHSPEELYDACRSHCDEVGLCVWFVYGHYAYTQGHEPGVAVGLINYPRFPSSPDAVRGHALELAKRLARASHQLKVTVVCPDETIMLEAGVDYELPSA